MTLQEAKQEVAKRYGFDNWDRIDFYMLDAQDTVAKRPYAEERLSDEAAELYAESRVDKMVSGENYCKMALAFQEKIAALEKERDKLKALLDKVAKAL